MAREKILSDATGKVVKEFIENLGQGKIMQSNKPINSILGGAEAAVRAATNQANPILKTFKQGAKDKMESMAGQSDEAIAAALKGQKWDKGKIAGSYIGAATGYRALSGGGVYRDKNGNTNLTGVPFV